MANTSGFNWTCPLLPTDFVWKEGRPWGPSSHLCGISTGPIPSWNCSVVATPGNSVSKNHRCFHRICTDQLWRPCKQVQHFLQVSEGLVVQDGISCEARAKSIQCFPNQWACGAHADHLCNVQMIFWHYLVMFFLDNTLPAFCRNTYSSSGLEKVPKEKDLIWALTTISAIIRNIFLSLGPNSYNANKYAPRSARSFRLEIPCWYPES